MSVFAVSRSGVAYTTKVFNSLSWQLVPYIPTVVKDLYYINHPNNIRIIPLPYKWTSHQAAQVENSVSDIVEERQVLIDDDIYRKLVVHYEKVREKDSAFRAVWQYSGDVELRDYLRLQASLMPRNTDLPNLLKRKAEAWRREKRPGWTDSEFYSEFTAALPCAMSDNHVDERMRRWVGQQDPREIRRFNARVGGVNSQRTRLSDLVGWLRLPRLQKWLEWRNAIQVLPASKND